MHMRVIGKVAGFGVVFLMMALSLGGCSSIDFGTYQAEAELEAASMAQPRRTSEWPSYAGTGSARFTSEATLTRQNIEQLEPAWSFRTGENTTVFQNTPILANGLLIVCSSLNKVSALDPLTGTVAWTYDAEVGTGPYPNQANCRALAQWSQSESPLPSGADAACEHRLFMATNEARLIALDGTNGRLCDDFGSNGEIDLVQGVGDLLWSEEYQVTSPPAVVGDVVVVGSAISDNQRVDAPSGVVRGFDVRSGALVWAFDLAPPGFDYAKGRVSSAGYALGTPNVWAGFATDEARDLVFLPTGNPAPDYYRTGPLDMAYYGSSVIALQASSGELVWHFKAVQNDFWDFDMPSIPSVVDLNLNGEDVPALIQSTKMGFIFVLNRETGEPLIDLEQREVPRYGPLKVQLSATQLYPPEAFRVGRPYVAGQSPLGLCDGLENDAIVGEIFTPITEQWTVSMPSFTGATNWGGVAVDGQRGLIALHTNSFATRVKLLDQSKAPPEIVAAMTDRQRPVEEREASFRAYRDFFQLDSDVEVGVQIGAGYSMARQIMLDPYLGALPCAGFPLGEVLVVDIAAQQQRWRRPHGGESGVIDRLLSPGWPQLGGPLLTSNGLFFIGSMIDSTLRAYDVENGELLWHHELPAPGVATPMSYSVADEQGKLRQFIVIAAGGDSRIPMGGSADYVVAFAVDADALE